MRVNAGPAHMWTHMQLMFIHNFCSTFQGLYVLSVCEVSLVSGSFYLQFRALSEDFIRQL